MNRKTFLFLVCSLVLFYAIGKEVKINENIRDAIKKFTINDQKEKSDILPKENIRSFLDSFYKKIKKSNSTFSNVSKSVVRHLFKEYLKCRIDCKKRSGKRRVFDWCACRKARACTRLYLILHILNKVAYKDRSEELVYVSFGSGRMLQDYLTIKALIKSGFEKINVNLIDVGYGNKQGLDIDCFLKTYYKPQAGVQKERKALDSFCDLMKDSRSIASINSYTTYFDFLEQWNKKPVDILLLIDPMKLCAELIKSKNPVYTNHVNIKKGERLCPDDLICLLPYKGKVKIFYKGVLKDRMKEGLLSQVNFYKDYNDRKKFVDFLHGISHKKQATREGNKNLKVGQSQSQRQSFYDLIKATNSKKALIYQVDENKIFKGKLNLLIDAYKKEGFNILK